MKSRFLLELDLRVYFTPLMHKHGQGICLTRVIDLPFVPNPKVALGGKSIEECFPLGYRLDDVIWDVDRKVFLAHTTSECVCDPIALIPQELQSLWGEGWAIGSWRRHYESDWTSSIGENLNLDTTSWNRVDLAELESWHTLPPNKRPRKFNELLKAVVRMMVMLHNNLPIAYAIYKTKVFVDPDDAEKSETTETKKFQAAINKYLEMDDEKQFKWMSRVRREFPTFASISSNRASKTRRDLSRVRRN